MAGRKLVSIVAITVVFLIAACLIGYMYLNSSPLPSGKKILFQIKPGSGFYAVAEELSRRNVIRSLRFFKFLGKLRNVSARLKAGYYHIDSSMSASQLLDLFTSGKIYTIRVTIPEGCDNRRIGGIMEKHHLVKSNDFVKAAADGSLLARFGFKGRKTCEGFLFPDTYLIPWGADSGQIVRMMIRNFKRVVGKDLLAEMKRAKIGFYKTLILASIVEREVRKPAERPIVAGVFLNRYKVNMKFESCASIQYVLGRVEKNLYYYHLKIKSPYNTYINPGFPPGPIANPGLASIKAATRPARHKYLYFVAKGDGSHYFSSTGKAHNRAAYRYQWSRKQDEAP